MARFVDLSIFKRNAPYALLYSGQFISFMGTMITMVALPFQIYHRTHSTVLVGLLSLVQLLPLLITALVGGVLADRHARRGLLIFSEALLSLGCLVLAFNASRQDPSLLLVFITAALMSAITGLHRPAFEGAIQQIIDEKDYKTVGALHTFEFGFCSIIGPAIAGFIIAQLGLSFTFFIDFASFVCSIFCLIALGPLPKPPQSEHKPIVHALKEGIHFAYKRPVLLGSYCVDFAAMVFAMPNALFPAIALSLGGVETLGLLYAAPAFGALCMSLWSGWTAHIRHEGQAIALAAIGWGIAIIGFGLSYHLLLCGLFFLALAGACDAISGIFRSSLWNHLIPKNFRGRMAGIEMLSYISGPRLGDTRAGLMAGAFGISTAIISGGLLCVLSITFCCYRMRTFWDYRTDTTAPKT